MKRVQKYFGDLLKRDKEVGEELSLRILSLWNDKWYVVVQEYRYLISS